MFFKLYKSLCYPLIPIRCTGEGIPALDGRLDKIPSTLAFLILTNVIGRKEGRVNKWASTGDTQDKRGKKYPPFKKFTT